MNNIFWPCLSIYSVLISNSNKKQNMKALVISGGGSKGAFAGGVAEYLLGHCQKDYHVWVGTSAGCLLVPLLALGKIEKLKAVFNSSDELTV